MSLSNMPFDEESRKRRANQLYRESIDHMSDEEVSKAASMGDEKYHRLDEDVPSALEAVWRELRQLIAMLRDYVRGDYRRIPFGAIAAIGAAVLYFVSPVDAIPDFIPGLGYIDDAAVLMTCLRMVRGDIEAYCEWCSETVGAAT